MRVSTGAPQQKLVAPSERTYAVIRFNILVFSRSLTVSCAAACSLAALLCSMGGCSTYGAELLGSALSNAGISGGGASAMAGAGAADGGETSDAGAHQGGAQQGGSAGTSTGGSAGANAGNGGSTANNGGSAGVAPGGTGGGAGAVVVDPNLIDDLEDNDKSVLAINNPRRDGTWDTGNDGTATGTQVPAPFMFTPTLIGASPPHADDKYAAYMKGSGFTSYGAYMNVSMRSWAIYNDTPVYDASAYKGITFWAKVGSGPTITKALRVRFISADTDPRGKKCKVTTDVPAPTHDQLCYNHYFYNQTLSTTWQHYSIAFSDFLQAGDGMVNPSIDLAGMYGLEFYFSQGNDFEIWIDDLAFVK